MSESSGSEEEARGGGDLVDRVGADPGGVSDPGAPTSAELHRGVLLGISGLFVATFVSMLSSTIVTNALPRITEDLGAGQATYTWVVTSTLLAQTAATPLWGKLADLTDPRRLVSLSVAVFLAGSVAAALAPDAGVLIAGRTLQGVGAGGVMILTQVVMARIVPARERGRYNGWFGAVFALATVIGPLVGGLLVDAGGLGWRWCFWIGVPFAALALVVVERTLRVPVREREIRIDYAGAALLVGGITDLLVWVSLGGQEFAWGSLWTALLVPAGIVMLALAAVVESRAAEPVVPLGLFRDRTMVMASLASVFYGSALYAVTVFLAPYFQIARGVSPVMSGLLSFPLILSMAAASMLVGRWISRTGRWKPYLVGAAASLVAGLLLLATVRVTTPYALLAVAMVLCGFGTGATMQNLVLAVQNSVAPKDTGSASATVTFLRSLGGAVGISALGAVLTARRHAATHGPGPAAAAAGYSSGVALVFGISAAAALAGALLILAVREKPLATEIVDQ
ncbi:MDR family MFS transporter [Streptomyces sp. NPDC026672]|uniref:MDR family MFS transporter n=1 Tax=unclassified Streptomyces TaxID=2593676 RepID=UPI0033E82C02